MCGHGLSLCVCVCAQLLPTEATTSVWKRRSSQPAQTREDGGAQKKMRYPGRGEDLSAFANRWNEGGERAGFREILPIFLVVPRRGPRRGLLNFTDA